MSQREEENQLVRDLVWAVSSPPLLSLAGPDEVASIDLENVDRSRLAAFFRERSEHRVGHYFENLIHFWLTEVRGVELVAHRQSVHDGERTVGELDFVFRDEAGRLTHWEVAVKFYLLTSAHDGPPRYLGPNTTDSLPRKITRMVEHQLPLSGRVYPDIASRRAFVKGLICYHPSADRNAAGLAELDPGHTRGVWLQEREVADFVAANVDRAAGFAVLRKPFWLTANGRRGAIRELAGAADRHFAVAANAMHVALADEAGDELRRLFVVPNAWPHRDCLSPRARRGA